MGRLIFLILIATATIASAKEVDYRSYFTYPDTQVMIDFGDGHGISVPYKNHSVPKKSSESPVFQSGSGQDKPDFKGMVYWRFIQKTETGDLYLISVYQDSHLLKEVPVIYTGSASLVYDRGHIKVTIEPAKGEE